MFEEIRPVFFALFSCFCAIILQAAPSQEQLIATLQSGAPLREKWAAAHELAGIATADAVPKLAALLADEQCGDLARCVLEPLPSPSVDEALRNALATAKGRPLAGVIASLGVRRDAKAVPLLVKHLDDGDKAIVSTTLAALGRIGTVSAAKAIEDHICGAHGQTQPQFWAALVQCAETLREQGRRSEAFSVFNWILSANAPVWIHEAGVRGAILAGGRQSSKLLAQYLKTDTSAVLRLAQSDLPGSTATGILVAGLANLSQERQVLVIEALGQRGDADAAAALIRAARNGEKPVRLAAIRSVPPGASLVPALVVLVSDADTDIAQAARDRLASLPGAEADSAVLKLLNSETPELRLAAMKMASRRRLASAAPALVKAAASPDAGLANAALVALGETASETDLDALLGLLSRPSVDADSFESILVAVGSRARHSDAYADKMIEAFPKSTPAAKCVLLRVLEDLDSAKALRVAREALADSNNDVQKTALRIVALNTRLKAYPFFPFCIDWHDAKKRNYVQQAAMLKALGYEGVGHIWLDGVAERLNSLDAAGLKLFQITMLIDLTPGKAPYDARFKDVLALVKGRHMQFDLIINGMPPSEVSADPRAVEILRGMSDLAKRSGAQLLLYPHQGSWIERIEDAVRVADQVNRPNVGVMFNLCHWLRVDKQRDYKPLLVQALPKLWAVSICGADDFDPAPGWAHYIQPLDKGSFDVGLFLKTLKEVGYKGPIGLQCYGIGGDACEHLTRSLAAWQKISENLKRTTN